jgi:hypothetical protein
VDRPNIRSQTGEGSNPNGKKPAKRLPIITPEPYEPGIHERHIYPKSSQEKTFTFPVLGRQAQEYHLSPHYRRYVDRQDSRGRTYRYSKQPTPSLPSFHALFSNILLFLPFNDLCLARLINRSWKNLINTSLKLQQALFLQPTGSYHAYVQQPDEGLSRVKRRTSFWTTKPEEKDRKERITVFEHPLIAQFPRLFDPHSSHQASNNRRAAAFRQRFGHMLATQPPMAWLELREAKRGTIVERKLADWHSMHKGVTLGQMMLFALDGERVFEDEIYFTGSLQVELLLCGHGLEIAREEARVRERWEREREAAEWRRRRDEADRAGGMQVLGGLGEDAVEDLRPGNVRSSRVKMWVRWRSSVGVRVSKI